MENDDKDILEIALKWRAMMDDEMSEHDHRAFGAWLVADPRHARAYDRAEQGWRELGALTREDLGLGFEARVERATPTSTAATSFLGMIRGRTIAIGGGLAACFAIAVVALNPIDRTAPPTVRSVYQTAIGEVRDVALPDGSVITVGASSTVATALDADGRRAELTAGEAFFDVAPDPARPFSVSTRLLSVRVTGTAFDVSLKPEKVRVSVAEGSVDVSYVHNSEDGGETDGVAPPALRLAGGERVAARDGLGVGPVETVDADAVGAWRRNRLAYVDAPLAELVADARRYYPAPIVIADDELAAMSVSAIFDATQIDAMFTTLSEALPLKVDKTDDGALTLRAEK
ncbi:MAG: FecR domain-containing protein [Pseudomonadota bacterium]